MDFKTAREVKTNKLAPEDLQFKMIGSMACTTYHHSKFINEEFGIEMEKITPIKDWGNFGIPKTYFYITGQEKEYTDLEELCKDWNEIKNYDDPEGEIKWVKVMIKKQK